jgi:hypothetical protein
VDASSWDDWERNEGYVAVSAMIGGGQHAQPERMLTRQVLCELRRQIPEYLRQILRSEPLIETKLFGTALP